MTKKSAPDNLVKEALIRTTRSSPRKRNQEAHLGTDTLESRSPRAKRARRQGKEGSVDTELPLKQETFLNSPPRSVNGKSAKQGRKRGSRLREEDIGSKSDERASPGIRTETVADRVQGKEILKANRKVKREDSDTDGHNTKKRDRKTRKTVKSGKAKAKEAETSSEEDTDDVDRDTTTTTTADAQKAKGKRKSKKEKKEAEDMPLAARSSGLRMFVGAHVSIAKGIQNSITNCQHIGGNAFALFLKSQRKWDNPALTDDSCEAFKSHVRSHDYDSRSHILPHGSYLVNLAQEDDAKAKQAHDAFLDDLQRCERLGIRLYNFHPGAATQSPIPEAIKRIADQLNSALASTSTVVPVLENMAGSGTVIGSRFTELRDIISHIRPEFRSAGRIGVCLDTCHAFAAGYDLRDKASFDRVLAEFDALVGLDHLKALHLNDSKAPLGSKRDLHQNIGLGFLGLRAFHNVMNEPRLENLPLILETPCERPDPDADAEETKGGKTKKKKMIEDKTIWATEIKLLESLIGMDVESDRFRALEQELSERGREEREKMQKAFDEKNRSRGKDQSVSVPDGNPDRGRGRDRGQRSLLDMIDGGAGNGGEVGQDEKRKKVGNENEKDDNDKMKKRKGKGRVEERQK